MWIQKETPIEKALLIGFYPFMTGNLLKIFLVATFLPFLRKKLEGGEKWKN